MFRLNSPKRFIGEKVWISFFPQVKISLCIDYFVNFFIILTYLKILFNLSIDYFFKITFSLYFFP